MRLRLNAPSFLVPEGGGQHALTDTFSRVSDNLDHDFVVDGSSETRSPVVRLWCSTQHSEDPQAHEGGCSVPFKIYSRSITCTSCWGANSSRQGVRSVMFERLLQLCKGVEAFDIDIEVVHPLQLSAIEHMLDNDLEAGSSSFLAVLCAHTAGILLLQDLQDVYEAACCEEGLEASSLLVLAYSIRHARLSPMMYALAELKRQGVGLASNKSRVWVSDDGQALLSGDAIRCSVLTLAQAFEVDFQRKERFLFPISSIQHQPSAIADMTKCTLERYLVESQERREIHFVLKRVNDGVILACATYEHDGDQVFLFCPGDSANEGNEGSSMNGMACDLRKDSPYYLGRIEKIVSGTRLHFYDYGFSRNSNFPESLEAYGERTRCVVNYETNILGNKPNRMRTELATYGDLGTTHLHSPFDDTPMSRAGLVPYAAENRPRICASKRISEVHRMETRKPVWDHNIGGWTLKFDGRVTFPSKKNFLLVSEDDPQCELMLFGKVKKNKYALDFNPPFSATTALFVALTTFVSKLAVC